MLDGLRRNREATARYLADEPVDLNTAPTVSVVGRLPLLSVVLGQAYELAVHGLDLVSCGAEPPPPDVLHSGLAALVDVTGALAASMDIAGRVTLAIPDGGWGFLSDPHGWTVTEALFGSLMSKLLQVKVTPAKQRLIWVCASSAAIALLILMR